ncbi:MAG TPA: 2OG-Fe(II) oxygenase [Polyangiaceae bacterium]|nr:2OG-Fe(II) oxygenase [Polyangiaceae bacterium]
METTTTAPHLLDERYCIMTLPGVLSPAECASLIDFAERQGFGDAPVSTGLGFVMMPELRNNTRVMVDDLARAAELWRRVEHAVPRARGASRAVGLNERFRFYRYDVGQRFGWHRDGAFDRSGRERSHLTLMFYLNDDFEGGATEFDDGLVVTPRRGSALVFAHPVRHQGAAVTRGRKYVLRTDVMYRRDG